jgi:hypothetical protein
MLLFNKNQHPATLSTLICLLAFLTIFFFPDRIFSRDSTLIPFTLKDQFDRLYTREDFAGQILVVVGSDKEGSHFNQLWGVAIHDSLKKYHLNQEVRFLPVANVRGVPFFLKGFVKGKFPREKKSWVLLDWKGIFAKAYEFIPGATNILLIRRDGRVAYQMHGHEPESDQINELLEVLYRLPGMQRAAAAKE